MNNVYSTNHIICTIIIFIISWKKKKIKKSPLVYGKMGQAAVLNLHERWLSRFPHWHFLKGLVANVPCSGMFSDLTNRTTTPVL